MREFTQISFNPSKGLVLKWQTPVRGEDDEDGHFTTGFKSPKTPHDGFLKALKALGPDIPKHCEMPEDWYKERIIILGVKLSHDDAGLKSASIQSNVGLHSGNTISINGPSLKVKGEAHEMLEEACVHRLRTLMKEADKVLKTIASRQAELFPASLPQAEKSAETKPAKAKVPAKDDGAKKPASEMAPGVNDDKPGKAEGAKDGKPGKAAGGKGGGAKAGGTNGSTRKDTPSKQAIPSTRQPRRAAARR